MKTIAIHLLLLLTLIVSAISSSLAQCAYTQSGNNWQNGYLSVHNAGSYNQIIADDIFVPAGQCWTIGSVVLSYATPGAAINLVNVVFYDDAGGIPGAVALSGAAQFNNVAFTAVPNGNPFGINAFLLNITLPTSVTLCGGASGTRYWFGSNARGAGGTNTYWEVHESTTVNGIIAHIRDFNAFFCPSTTWYPINNSCFIGPDADNAQPVFTLNITSGAPPFLNCPSNISANVASGQCSAVVNFSPATTTCTGQTITVPYSGAPVSIPDAFPAGVNSNIVVSTFGPGATLGGTVSLTRVCFQINHTWVGDLVVRLRAPDGTTITLMDRPGPGGFGCSGENVDVCIVPGVGNEIEDAPCGSNPAYSGNFTAHGGIDLSSINNGGPANGTWQLFAADLAIGDVGSIISWSLEFQTTVQIAQTAGLPSGSSFPLGTTTNTFTATDAFGNTSTCSFNVTVIDNIPPSIACPSNISGNVDPGQCTATINYTLPTATDNCTQTVTESLTGIGVNIPDDDPDGVTSILNVTQFGSATLGGAVTLDRVCFQINHTWVGDLVVKLRAPDGTTITLMDRPGPGVFGCSGDNVDVCIVPGVGNEIEDAPCGSNPAYSGNFTAHGGIDLSSINNGGPANGTWQLFAADLASGDVGSIISWSLHFTKGIPTVTLTSGLPSGTAFPVGTTVVTYTATDGSSNTATCSFNVTIVDNEAPVITCPASITVNNTPGSCAATVSYTTPVGTDNCTGQTITVPYSGAPVSIPDNNASGVNSNNIVSTFGSGATLGGTVSLTRVCFQINHTWVGDLVVRLRAPDGTTITLMDRPGPGTFGCSGDNVDVCIVPGVGNEIENAPCGNNPAYSGNFTAHGGIDLSSINNGGPANGTWQLFAADLAGGDVGSIISWSLEFQTSVQTVQTAGLPSGSAFPVGITVNTFRSTDAYGNVSQCSFDVQVLDAEPPVWVCPADLYVATDPGRCDAVVNFSVPAVTDNCPGVSVVQTGGLLSGDVFPLGTTSIIFEASDASGNTSLCVFDIIVEDTEDPIITCPSDIITLTPQGTCEATVFFNDATATDNCSNPAVVQTSGLPSGAVFPVGNSVVSFQATDDAGNTASCSFNITVNDAETPVISCPQSFTVTNDIGDCGSIVLFANATATDNCPGVDVIQTAGPTSGSVFPVGITTVAFRATDASGNTAVCSFTITVLDTESPQITCPSDITVTNDPGLCGAVITYQVITTDNCPGETLVQTSGLASGSTFPVGSILNAFRVTDASGNQGTCSFTVTVNPNPVPVADAGPDVAICQGGNATLTASGGIAYEWSHGDTTAITTVAPAQTTTYTVTVTDVNGCTASDNVTVTVNSLPSVSFTPLNPTYCVDGPAVTLTGTPPGGTFSGNGVSGNSFSPAAAGKGTATITYTYTDSNGCTGSQTQTTEVEVCIGMATIASSEIHVYPNPFEHRIHISVVSHIKQNMLIRMTDLNGKEVYRAAVELKKGNNLFDIAHDSMLADALYILELTTREGTNIYRLIKQRQ